jgi:ribosomal protein L37AE/L43A
MSATIEITCRQAEGIPPPECCQPPLATRTARLERAQAVAEAIQPTRCPNCSSRWIAPLFWVDVDVWDCSVCCAIFSGRPV